MFINNLKEDMRAALPEEAAATTERRVTMKGYRFTATSETNPPTCDSFHIVLIHNIEPKATGAVNLAGEIYPAQKNGVNLAKTGLGNMSKWHLVQCGDDVAAKFLSKIAYVCGYIKKTHGRKRSGSGSGSEDEEAGSEDEEAGSEAGSEAVRKRVRKRVRTDGRQGRQRRQIRKNSKVTKFGKHVLAVYQSSWPFGDMPLQTFFLAAAACLILKSSRYSRSREQLTTKVVQLIQAVRDEAHANASSSPSQSFLSGHLESDTVDIDAIVDVLNDAMNGEQEHGEQEHGEQGRGEQEHGDDEAHGEQGHGEQSFSAPALSCAIVRSWFDEIYKRPQLQQPEDYRLSLPLAEVIDNSVAESIIQCKDAVAALCGSKTQLFRSNEWNDCALHMLAGVFKITAQRSEEYDKLQQSIFEHEDEEEEEED